MEYAFFLGQWLNLERRLAEHLKSRPPEEGTEFPAWKDQETKIRHDIERWSVQYKSRQVNSLSEFVGWLRDSVDIFEQFEFGQAGMPGAASGPFLEPMRWACREADRLDVIDRPLRPRSTANAEDVLLFYDQILVAAKKRKAEMEQHFKELFRRPSRATSVTAEELQPPPQREEFHPASYFNKHHRISATTLSKARKSGRLPNSDYRGTRWFYSTGDVRSNWPERFQAKS